MGLFDYVRCEMALPETPLPPADEIFQTKTFEDPYMETYVITADGRLVKREVEREFVKDELSLLGGFFKPISERDVELPYHGDVHFGTISLHRGQFSGGEWDYRARFTDGRCVGVFLEGFSPPDPERVEEIDAWHASRLTPTQER
jgi:hypothetical protein